MIPHDEPGNSVDEQLAQQAATWFARIHSDRVTAADRTAFRRWLVRHPQNRKAYSEIESLWAGLGEVADPRPAKKTASPPQALPRPAGKRFIPQLALDGAVRWGALAACLLLAFWVTWGGTDALVWMQADHRTAPGEARQVMLPDGSRVHLNTDTALVLDFDAGHRRVRLLGGEAFFDVAHDPARPFEVAAGDGITRVTGTRFNVLDRGRNVTVTVVSGSVEVLKNETSAAHVPAQRSKVRLSPGQAAEYQPRQAEIATRTADEQEAISWRQGKLIFTDRPLREVIAELERYRSGSILLMDEAIAKTRFTGVIDLARIDPALDALEQTLPARVIHMSDYLVMILAVG
ncbi:putative Iron dicitrate transport regulator FecR [Nitrospina watsonii]|uniref:Iron dicitrate transport regulator FecR n=1 Tax=Nitrospina watsonii TaxID=1323948 RepID=A0ABM9HAF8_9BACT|nr:putative Iron dicitrate transport regulator FecR [Nitrospina watsonii]